MSNMDGKKFGMLLIGISLLIAFITWSFNTALSGIVAATCDHGLTCTMWSTIEFQTHTSIAIIVAVLTLGIYFLIYGEKSTPKKDYSKILKTMKSDERTIFETVIKSNGAIFQSEIVEETGFSKVKVTRALDRLEGQGVIERRRRGMTNVIVLKED
ncbi:MAG: MarR family transcriptional regulator [Candidatus Altiarchaeota archaeon]|nr:MarR family transcriptional regulator [Candidatus Altiarchaeota archaeon]